MDTENGSKIAFVQIAGLVARRIICDVDIGSSLKAGEIFGLIRFGSRVDIYFPSEVSVMVLKGQKTIAGETIIGDFSKNAKPVKETIDENRGIKLAKKALQSSQTFSVIWMLLIFNDMCFDFWFASNVSGHFNNWNNVIIMIIIASVFDMLDGRVARLLKSASEFGMHLDSFLIL